MIVTVLPCPEAMAAAGKMLLVSGTVTLEGKAARDLKAGDTFDSGDVVTTGERSRAHLLMADGTRIALRAGSRVRIDEFAMPSSVRQPDRANAASAEATSVITLLQGGFTSRGAMELKTPTGTVSAHAARYTAVLCEGDCADVRASVAAEPIAGALYVAVDEGSIAFDGDGVRRTLTASRRELIPLEDSHPSGWMKPEIGIPARTPLGRTVDLIDPQPPFDPKMSVAVSVPGSNSAAFVASSTDARDALTFNSGSNLLQLDAPFFSGSSVSSATYLSGTASMLDFGSSGASGIRWGRWSYGQASISTVGGSQPVDLQRASLHWIAGPVFEAPPVIPASGTYHFLVNGGTSPTDGAGQVGRLGTATLTADFTSRQIEATLSLDVNGYNWFASGTGALISGTARFDGTFGTVLVDGRIAGTGAFTGFLSAGALTPDQLNGAGLSYWLSESVHQLGTVSGVVAFEPGAPLPLSPPPIRREVAYAAGRIDGQSIVGGVAANSHLQLALDSNGNITMFRAPVPRAESGTLAIGVASVTDTGAHTATGIRWGRWAGGAIDVTTPPTASQSNDMTGQSLHWIAGNEYGSPPVLPQTGTATYALVGNTSPTDTLGNTGVLGAASFEADFTSRFIRTKLTLNVGGFDWYASGEATFPIGGNRFEGTYDDVRIQNLARGQGTIYGFFTQPRAGSGTVGGAGLSFDLADNAGELGVVSGVLAFAESGQGAVVTPYPTQQRDIAMVAPDAASMGPFVQRAAPAEYVLDSDFALTRLPGVTNSGTVDAARYDIGTSIVAESDVSPLLMLRWGRWAGSNSLVVNLSSSTTNAMDLSQRSLHWIEGADTAAPPVIPQFGTANYALMGGTTPTDRAGHTGVLHNASLTANFTSQIVSAAFDITVNNFNVVATGSGQIGASAGLAAHQFTGTINGGVVNPTLTVPQGSFSGFFSAPGGTVSGVPGGAGVTYSIADGNGLFVIDGAAAFRGP